MRLVEIQVKINIARREMEYWQSVIASKSCNDCQEFQQGVCQKWNAKPPEETTKSGCDEWNWDCIPF